MLALAAAPPAAAGQSSAAASKPSTAPAALTAEAEPAPPPTAEPVTADPEAAAKTDAALNAEHAAQAREEQVKNNLEAVRQILQTGLTNSEAGELLRESRRRAPEPADIQRRIAARQREAAEAQIDRVRLMERRRLAGDPAEERRLAAELAKQETYQQAVQGVLVAENHLKDQSTELVTLLDSRLLWIGSAPPVGRAWAADVAEGLRWAGNPRSWFGAARTFLRRVGEVPLGSALGTLLFAALVFGRFKLAGRLAFVSSGVGRYASDRFSLTARALALTVLLALPVPVALGGAGWLLETQSLDPFSQELGSGLLAAGAVCLLLDFFRLMCRGKGLADAHFQWNPRARRTLLNNLRWLVAVEVPAALVGATCDAGGAEVFRQGLGRLAFIVGSVGLTVFVARVFRPGSGVFSEMMRRDGWAWRLRKIWYGMLVAVPAAMTLLAAAGYYYTATEVMSRFFTSGVAVLSGVVVYSLMTRWLLVTRRRVATRQARQRLAEAREARRLEREQGGSVEPVAAGDAVPELEPQVVDVAAASDRALSLLRTAVAVGILFALWGIWRDLLPALRDVRLTGPSLAEGVAPTLTLWSLLMGLVVAALTVLAARNLPAALELTVLERFPLDPGVRYAAATLTRYAVVAAGVVIASRLLNFDWSKAQWIIAALGVGLGFGLQEIVANFVSGLIILFERPVRVGDTVTVGDVSGTVSRLQIRATTLTDFDNKEVIVPNKSFITDPVVNWTLSNPVTRLLIPVGVAYGSDVTAASAAISGAVAGVPSVLGEPAPSVLFVGFGDSSLNFEVRCFVGELSKRLTTLDALHRAIDAALREANIEIPFPQRDLHLRSSDIGRLVGDAHQNGQAATDAAARRN